MPRSLILAALLLLCLYVYVAGIRGDDLPIVYFLQQDRFILILAVAGFAVSPWLQRYGRAVTFALSWERVSSIRLWVLALGIMAVLLWWGTYALMYNYALTRDEHMVLFDAAVFSHGHLAEPLASFWQPYAQALVPNFLLQPDGPVGLVSAYLPGNALMRLAFSRLADPALLNPLLAALGGLALLDIARREFRDDAAAVLLVMIVYLSSAQMLVNAMTAYAMTAHLALNLIWLAFFLRGGRMGHGLAMLVGAYACGLHQLVFHPLFVAPFLMWRLGRREYRVVLFYGVGYAIACIGWIVYPMLVQMVVTRPGTVAEQADFLHGRLLPLLLKRDPNMVYLLAYNLGRFFAWQNLAVLPLMIAAWPMVRGNRGLAAPLLAGLVLTDVVVTLILPFQGHGWGYRYLHGFIGSVALLAGYGFALLRREIRNVGSVASFLTGLTVFVSIPWLFYQSHDFAAPFAAVDRLVGAQRTPLVVVDTQFPSNMVDNVRNLPDLSNRPIRLSSLRLTPGLLAGLCARGPITLITRADMHKAGMVPRGETASPEFDRLVRDAGAARSCFRAARTF